MEKTIICIGREYGSGGHEIGELLAKRTGFTIKRSCLKLQRCADTRKKCRSIWMNSRWTAFFIQSQ